MATHNHRSLITVMRYERRRKKPLLSKACCAFYYNCCQIIVTLQSRLEISLTVATGIENHFKFVPNDLFGVISLQAFSFFPPPCFDSHHFPFTRKKRVKLKTVINVRNGLQVSGSFTV